MWPNPQFSADLVIFSEEKLNGKLYFLCSKAWRSYLILRDFYHGLFSALHEKCPYSEFFWSIFSRIRTRIQPECRKIRTRKLRIWTLFTQWRLVIFISVPPGFCIKSNEGNVINNTSRKVIHQCWKPCISIEKFTRTIDVPK